MAGGMNVGSIYYEVEADTSKLVNSSASVDSTLDKMNKRFDQTDKAANQAQFQMTKTAVAVKGLGREATASTSALKGLSGVLAGVISLQGVSGLIQMAEAYNEMAERLQMATSSAAEYNTVQTRLLETSNKTYRSLAEAQELYIRTSAALKSMGYDTEAALDVTDSLSYSFVKNATSVDRAKSATDAFSKVLNKGRVEADAWETILAAIPTVVGDVAAATGKSAEEVRRLGVNGQLTARQLSEGLRTSLDENKKAADGMATTIKDAFTALRNNLSAMVGEANRSTGATGVLSKAVLTLAENLQTLVSALLAIGAGAMARYLASLTASTVANARAALGAKAQAAAALEQAVANEKAAAAAAGQAAAQVRLGGSLAASTAAANAHRAAQTALAAAQRTATAAGTGLVAMLGGPAGIIGLLATAAAGVYLFGDNSKKAAPNVDELANAVDNLTQAQLELRRIQVGDAIQQIEKEAREASRSVSTITKDIIELQKAQQRGANLGADGLENANRTLVEQRANLDEVNGRLQKLYELQERLANQKPRERTSAVPSAPESDPEVAKRLQGMRDELELARLTGAARARLQAIQKLGANATAQERAEAEKLATTIYDLEQAQRKGVDGTKKSTEAAKENQKVIDGLATALYEAGLAGAELEVVKAKAALNPFATPEQVAQVEALARAISMVNEAEQKKKLLGQVDPIAGAQMEFQTQIENLRKLNEAKLLEDQRYLELKAQAETAYDERARMLQEENFRRQSTWNELLMSSLDQLGASAADTLVGIATGATTGEDAIKALAGAILKQGVSALVQMGIQYVKNLIMGKAAGAAATAFGIAQAATLATAWAVPAALASLASFGANSAPAMAGISSTVGLAEGLAMVGGGRLYGGGVDAAKMYRINENGQPEIFNAANGQQYMLPNRRGEVVSNRDATGQGESTQGWPMVNVNLIEDRSRAGEVTQTRDGQFLTVDAFVADIRGGGEMSQAIESTYGTTRQGR
ncbi:tape measure protein [Achromobacter xylosoxidans]|uniref:tape measure protein n=1 Tax=Alcaligenes xylosoxydans xylosoxydans TaxID=85698 RepID=UPI0013C88E57|nr:tape measure protein [Achromobacter xylosoxidans]NEV03846.1 tape measure protein [Achromobacter xylosoxidans]